MGIYNPLNEKAFNVKRIKKARIEAHTDLTPRKDGQIKKVWEAVQKQFAAKKEVENAVEMQTKGKEEKVEEFTEEELKTIEFPNSKLAEAKRSPKRLKRKNNRNIRVRNNERQNTAARKSSNRTPGKPCQWCGKGPFLSSNIKKRHKKKCKKERKRLKKQEKLLINGNNKVRNGNNKVGEFAAKENEETAVETQTKGKEEKKRVRRDFLENAALESSFGAATSVSKFNKTWRQRKNRKTNNKRDKEPAKIVKKVPTKKYRGRKGNGNSWTVQKGKRKRGRTRYFRPQQRGRNFR